MGSKQDDYNRGQKDGAKAGGFDEFVESNFSLESPEYKKGFEHGRQQQLDARAKEPVRFIPSSNTESARDSGGGGGFGGAVGGGLGGAATGLGGAAHFLKVLLPLMFLFLAMKYCFPPAGSIRDTHDIYLDLFRQAQTDITAGNYKDAIPLLDQAIQIYPRDAASITQRANAYRDTGQSDRALQDYNQVIAINPGYLEAYFHRGILFLKIEAYPKAISDFNICIERDKTGPTAAYYYSDRGLAYLNSGQNARAIEDFNEALRSIPNDSFSRESRGLAYLRSGEFEAAIRDYDVAISLAPNDAWSHVHRGVAYEYMSQFDSAIKDYDEALRINPNFTEAYTARQHAEARLSYRAPADDAFVKSGVFQLGKVITCENARAWGAYEQKSTFRTGDRLCVYAEAWNVSEAGQVDVLFTFTILDQNQQVIMSRETPGAGRSTHPSWASWQYFDLPPDTQPGFYTVRVNIRNNLTGESSVQVVRFSIEST